VVAFDQMSPLGELTVRWTGTAEGEIDIHDEFDGDPADDEDDDDDPAGEPADGSHPQEDERD
jgi:segregation and condensation protein A